MDISAEEKQLLLLLETGKLDGDVGDIRTFRVYHSVKCGRYIKNGVPTTYHEGKEQAKLLEKETETSPIIREEERCLTPESKLLFLQRFGWLIDNEQVRNYSKKYKPKKAERNLP